MLRRRALFLAPVGVAILGGGAFYEMLSGMRTGRFDPHEVGTPLAGKPAPAFSLAPQAPGPAFTASDLRSLHRPVLINFFASWCIPCVEEAPLLGDLRNALPIWGIAYKDKPDDAAGFITRTGDPYQRVGADPAGTVAIDWGVTGVPESFLIGRDGLVAWHFAGPLTQDVIDRQLMTRLA